MICAAVAPLAMAGAPQPVRLQPSSPWDVDYAENSCRLIRTFGVGNELTKLVFESAAPGEVDMLVIGKPLRTGSERASAKFLPVDNKSFDGSVAAAVGSNDPAILWPQVPTYSAATLAEIERERDQLKRHPGVRPPPVSLVEQAARRADQEQYAQAVTEIEIDSRAGHPVILESGSLGEAMAAFDKCNRDSLKDWGVNPDLENKIVRPVWAVNPSDWLFWTDYPEDMLIRGKESQVEVRLLIDASGKITKCTSLSHFEEEEFNRITCAKILKRARFEPAELADGAKVPSYYVRRAIFRIGH